DLYHIGDYKNATNVYTEKKYTQAHREATQSLVEDWYHEFLRGVAEGRGMRPEEAEAAIQRGPFTSQEALAARLVDKLAFPYEAYRLEVEMTKRSKPVVTSMSDVAASGGYWISMSADKIVAEPGTLTGSIGVVTGKFNLHGLYEKLGLSKDFVATTENSTL